MARINASINMSRLKKVLLENPKLIAFKSKTGDYYVNVTIWINADTDDFNNDVSIQLNPPKDVELSEKIYVGNGRTDTTQKELLRRKELADSKIHAVAEPAKPPIETEIEGKIVQIEDLPF